jgi:hypothetical protein
MKNSFMSNTPHRVHFASSGGEVISSRCGLDEPQDEASSERLLSLLIEYQSWSSQTLGLS